MDIKQYASQLFKKLSARNEKGSLKIFESPLFYVISSLVIELVIEMFSCRSFWGGFLFMLRHPIAYVFSSAIIFFTLCLCFLIPKRVLTYAIVSVLWLGLGIANFVLQSKRVTPLTVVDITLIPSVSKIFSVYLSTFEIVLICIAIALVVVLLVFGAIKLKSHKVELKKGGLSFVCSAMLLFLLFNTGTATGALATKFGNISDAYLTYGFPYCFISGIFDQGISKPQEYSKESIGKILDKIGSEDTNKPEKTPNVIYVQLESFFDVNCMNFLEYSSQPLPNYMKLKEEAISGKLNVPVIGAGTVNTEFEVLSGMNLAFFGAGEYPYKTILKSHTCESAAYNLAELGYKAHAIHNYEGSFYGRNEVYPYLGFDSFTSLEYMQNVEYNPSGKWPDDSVLVSQIIGTLESTEGQDFIMAVSVQGHGIYPPASLEEGYTESIKVSFKEGVTLENIEKYSYFVNQMYEMDEFVGELVQAIKSYDEDTVIVFYGDHLPSLELTADQLDNCTLYQTEYLAVSNFGLEETQKTFGELATYQLSARVLESLGINNGTLTKLHQTQRENESYEEYFYDLCYDMLYGKRYAYGENKEYYPVKDMKMGYKEIILKDYKIENGAITVYGENFTSWSKITVNGKVQKNTVFVSDTELTLEYKKNNIDVITVTQYSATDTWLSETKAIILKPTSAVTVQRED